MEGKTMNKYTHVRITYNFFLVIGEEHKWTGQTIKPGK